MSPEAQKAAIAGVLGIKPAWFLMKRGYYYRPNAQGYTSDPSEAGRFSDAEASLHVNPHDEPVTKHLVPTPDYGSDLNAIHEATITLSNDDLWAMNIHLAEIVDPEIPFAHATAAQRCEAFLRTLNLWDDTQ